MCHDKMNHFCDFIDRKIDDGTFIPMVKAANSSMRQIGKFLVFFVYFISTFLAFTSFFIIIPYEQLYKPAWLLLLLGTCGLYFLFNIQYHYYKARTIPPVANPGEEGDSFCSKCNYWKSDNAHHCSVCEKCVLGMDHHCIWINQCVGLHNHRHFFLFIANLTLAAATIIIAGYQSFSDHLFLESSQTTYCTTILEHAPLQDIICDYDGFARTSVVFCYLLSGILLVMVGGLTSWNIYLISIGCTYIDYLKLTGSKKNTSARKRLNKGFKANWRNFLGLRRNRTFFKCVIMPTALPPVKYEDISPKSDAYDIV
ncbi:Palmitoyltransferase [Caenorhabditis elegans]|uniref:Palmitoyltransferase n=1 Tax=Caenorhabditis elegans TaxID=6239 RepID=Q18585_CAEEL|nr:Palmitoyltransferase [Caenorhabditis elegans]CCD67187.1 Palmitoyltransferase [Caenorhabditis elegans]|eukprot:NP_508435.2 Palmitoyltransferase [Caenorhabditis elegans]